MEEKRKYKHMLAEMGKGTMYEHCRQQSTMSYLPNASWNARKENVDSRLI